MAFMENPSDTDREADSLPNQGDQLKRKSEYLAQHLQELTVVQSAARGDIRGIEL